MVDGRDVTWRDLTDGQSSDPATCPCEPMDAEDLLYLLYTSGTTAKPKGIVHTTGGYLVGVADDASLHLRPEGRRRRLLVRSGHRLGHGSQLHRLRAAVQRCDERPVRGDAGLPRPRPLVGHRRALRRDDPLHRADRDPGAHEVGARSTRRSTISRRCGCSARSASRSTPRRGCGTTSTSAASAAPSSTRGGRRRPGMILITPLPGITTTKPGSATRPFPGVDAAVFDDEGNEVGPGGGGYLVLRRPWPAMLRGIYGDHERYVETYWSRYPGVYFAGDGARIDEDGDFWLLGRVDDVMNVSGHRISTIEVESALVDHHAVAEAAVCGAQRPADRPGNRRVRDPEGRGRGLGRDARRAPRPCGEGDRRRSRSPRTSSSRPSCRRPARGRSCAACFATWPRTGRSATRRRLPTLPSARRSASEPQRPPTSSGGTLTHGTIRS